MRLPIFLPFFLFLSACAHKEPSIDLGSWRDSSDLYQRCDRLYAAMLPTIKADPKTIDDIKSLSSDLQRSKSLYSLLSNASAITREGAGETGFDPLLDPTKSVVAIRQSALEALSNDTCADFADQYLRDGLFASIHADEAGELAEMYQGLRKSMDFRTMLLLLLLKEMPEHPAE